MSLFSILRPALHLLDPETAHTLTIKALKYAPHQRKVYSQTLHTKVFGLDFPNPVGLAAGFDKNAEVPDAILGLGFGFAELGTVTPLAQSGNAKPRVFRLPKDQAVINRLGFNNDGLAAYVARLRARQKNGGIIGANVGANKDSIDRASDYEQGISAVLGLCDYITINISSPNTKGLRALQEAHALDELVERCMIARGISKTPMLVKIAPDLNDAELEAIAAIALARKIDGLIISNTTIDRSMPLLSAHAAETGGLSGQPLMDSSTMVLSKMHIITHGNLPLIGVGGIASGADAYTKICAGASLIQLYSALIYKGPGLIRQINRELDILLARDGFKHIADAVGTAHH